MNEEKEGAPPAALPNDSVAGGAAVDAGFNKEVGADDNVEGNAGVAKEEPLVFAELGAVLAVGCASVVFASPFVAAVEVMLSLPLVELLVAGEEPKPAKVRGGDFDAAIPVAKDWRCCLDSSGGGKEGD